MSEPKSFASLSPSLLARKGAAKPALRHQLNPRHEGADAAADHADEEPAHAAEVVEIGARAAMAAIPEIVRQQQNIAARITRRRSALAAGRNAAFTLRLDAERHLKLRLACTLGNRSAQQIVTEALDTLLASLPDVTDLATRAGKHR